MSLIVRGARQEFRRRRHEPVVALDEVDLEVQAEELVVVVGPSGSGKTTLLRAIAGLEPLQSGTVQIAERDVTRLPPGKRDVGLVFQELALFPHLNVADNIGFGVAARGYPRKTVRVQVRAAARTLGIEGLLHRVPAQLSGGERQRVALARALVRRPSVFLLDEPLSSLDAELRVRMREEIKDLQRRSGVAMLHVTHDQTEAMALGNRIVVLRAGKVEQVGTPEELWAGPNNLFVAGFLGGVPMNVLSATLVGETGDHVLGVRPERMRIVPGRREVDREGFHLTARVRDVAMSGEDAVVRLESGGFRLHVRMPWRQRPAVNGSVLVTWSASDVHRFNRTDGTRIQ